MTAAPLVRWEEAADAAGDRHAYWACAALAYHQALHPASDGAPTSVEEVAERVELFDVAFRAAFTAAALCEGWSYGEIDDCLDDTPEVIREVLCEWLIAVGVDPEGIAPVDARHSCATALADEVEQLRVQLAACGVAALGSPGGVAQPGDYGWSDSYQLVVNLYARYRALTVGPLPVYGGTGEPFTFTKGEPVTIEQAVHMALGAASTCWEDMSGTGVFQDDRARSVAAALLRFIGETTVPMPASHAAKVIADLRGARVEDVPSVPFTAESGVGDLHAIPTDGTVDADARLIRLLADRMERRLGGDFDAERRPDLLVSARDTVRALDCAFDDIASVVEAIVSDRGTRPETEAQYDDLGEAVGALGRAREALDYLTGWL